MVEYLMGVASGIAFIFLLTGISQTKYACKLFGHNYYSAPYRARNGDSLRHIICARCKHIPFQAEYENNS